MRISTSQIFTQGLDAILKQQSSAARTQIEVATGKRILTASDDPTGATKALNKRDMLAQTEQYELNIMSARNSIVLEESVLGNVSDVLQRVRELAVGANNGTLTDEERFVMAVELDERLNELLALANTRASNGEYIFSGFQARTRSFTPNSGSGFDYNGDEGQRHLRVSPSLQIPVTDSGAEIFRDIRTGNGTFTVSASALNMGSGVMDNGSVMDPTLWIPDTYSVTFITPNSYEVRDGGGGLVTSGTYVVNDTINFSGIEVRITGAPASGDSFSIEPSQNQDMFTTVSDLITALRIPVSDDADLAAVTQGVNRALINLDQVLNKVTGTRSEIGARLNVLDDQSNLNAGMSVQLQQSISDIEDVDLAEAVSRLNRQLLALEVAQQSFARIQNLSLFQFI